MKTKGMGIALLSAAALLGSAVAQAELPWTYAEIGFAKGDDTDEVFGSGKSDAFDLKGSIGFASMWHASASYIDGDADGDILDTGFDIDLNGYRIAVGAHPQLATNTQLVFDIAYFDYDLDADGGEASADSGVDGFGIGAGVRHGLTDKFELLAQLWYNDGDFDDDGGGYSDTSIELGGRYNWTPNVSTGLTFAQDGGYGTGLSTGDTLRLDVRWSFGGDVF